MATVLDRQVLKDVYETHRWDDMTNLCRCGSAVGHGGGASFYGAGQPGSHARHRAQMLAQAVYGPTVSEDDAAVVYRVWRRHPLGGCASDDGSVYTDDDWFTHVTDKLIEALEKRRQLADLTMERRFAGVLELTTECRFIGVLDGIPN